MQLEIKPDHGGRFGVIFAVSPSRGAGQIAFEGTTPTNISLTGHSFSFVVNNLSSTGAVAVTVSLDGKDAGSAKGSDMVCGWFKPSMGAKSVTVHGQ